MFIHTLALFLAFPLSTVSAEYVCRDVEVTKTSSQASTADYLFMVDVSGSMCPYISGLASGLQQFATLVRQSAIDARYAIVTFGGTATIRLQFTNDTKILESRLLQLGCAGSGQEASLEALRMALSPNQGLDLAMGCPASMSGSSKCNLQWRANATKVILLATDEDSDLPTTFSYRLPQQTGFCSTSSDTSGSCSGTEPSFTPSVLFPCRPDSGMTVYCNYGKGVNVRLSDPFQQEVNVTAAALLQNGVFLNMLIQYRSKSAPGSNYDEESYYWRSVNGVGGSDSRTTSQMQFGHPQWAVQNPASLTDFDAMLTLDRLRQGKLGQSLQAQVLAGKGFMRVYDIERFADASSNSMDVVRAFYRETVTITSMLQRQCELVPNPPKSTVVHFGMMTTARFVKSSTIVVVRPSPSNTAAKEKSTSLMRPPETSTRRLQLSTNIVAHAMKTTVNVGTTVIMGTTMNAVTSVTTTTPRLEQTGFTVNAASTVNAITSATTTTTSTTTTPQLEQAIFPERTILLIETLLLARTSLLLEYPTSSLDLTLEPTRIPAPRPPKSTEETEEQNSARDVVMYGSLAGAGFGALLLLSMLAVQRWRKRKQQQQQQIRRKSGFGATAAAVEATSHTNLNFNDNPLFIPASLSRDTFTPATTMGRPKPTKDVVPERARTHATPSPLSTGKSADQLKKSTSGSNLDLAKVLENRAKNATKSRNPAQLKRLESASAGSSLHGGSSQNLQQSYRNLNTRHPGRETPGRTQTEF